MASSVKALELANTHESDPKRRREWEISTRKELRRLAAIEQERTALLVNEQNLREELEALLASLGEPYGWHYTNNGGASVFHKGPSNKLDADMQAAADYPKVHRVKTLYALTNKDQA